MFLFQVIIICVTLMVSVLLAIIMYIGVEMPLAAIEKFVMGFVRDEKVSVK